jgi:hypothetical protein
MERARAEIYFGDLDLARQTSQFMNECVEQGLVRWVTGQKARRK